MTSLLRKPAGTAGKVHDITPDSAGWGYVGFGLYRLAPGESAAVYLSMSVAAGGSTGKPARPTRSRVRCASDSGMYPRSTLKRAAMHMPAPTASPCSHWP